MPSQGERETYPQQETRDSLEMWGSYCQRNDTGIPQKRTKSNSTYWKQRNSKPRTRRNTEGKQCQQRDPRHQKKLGRRKKRNDGNSVGAMPMEERPLMVSRKDLDTRRRRDTNHSYRVTSRTPTGGTWRNGKNYRTYQSTILLAEDKRRHQKIDKKLRHMSKDQGGPTCTLRIATVKRNPQSTMEINHYGLHHGPAKIRRI